MAEQAETITVEEAAERLGVHTSTLYARIRAGEFPGCQIGKRVIIPRLAFDEFMRTGRLPASGSVMDREELTEIVRETVREMFTRQRDILDQQLSELAETGPIRRARVS